MKCKMLYAWSRRRVHHCALSSQARESDVSRRGWFQALSQPDKTYFFVEMRRKLFGSSCSNHSSEISFCLTVSLRYLYKYVNVNLYICDLVNHFLPCKQYLLISFDKYYYYIYKKKMAIFLLLLHFFTTLLQRFL